MQKRDWRIFLCSVFFVLGFSSVFAALGVFLQTLLVGYGDTVRTWLGRIGGTIIIFFGIYTLDLIKIPWLQQEHKFKVKRYGSRYLTSFLFGAAFAAGWTPCVGAVLGAILTLAVANPASSFALLFSYSLGLGIPFLLVGLFTTQAKRFIQTAGPWLRYMKYTFGVILIFIGFQVFANKLGSIASFPFVNSLIQAIGITDLAATTSLNIGIAFLAGLVSFISPCVLPLIPGFLSYLAALVVE